MFILLLWLGNENLKIKEASIDTNNQLIHVEKQLDTLKNDNKNTHTWLKQLVQQQKMSYSMIEDLKNKVSKRKPSNNKKLTTKKKKKTKKDKKKDKKQIIKEDLYTKLNQYLSDFEKNIKNKKLKDAFENLKQFKKVLWKRRNDKDLEKSKVLSILSSVDLLQKQLESKKSNTVYSTDTIKNKLNVLKKPANNKKRGGKNGT